MSNKGRLIYVPSELLDELEDTMLTFNLPKKTDALRLIAKNNKILKDIKINIDFNLIRRKRK